MKKLLKIKFKHGNELSKEISNKHNLSHFSLFAIEQWCDEYGNIDDKYIEVLDVKEYFEKHCENINKIKEVKCYDTE